MEGTCEREVANCSLETGAEPFPDAVEDALVGKPNATSADR
jgi:hypothetical protein